MKRFHFPLTPVKAVRLQAKARASELLAIALRDLATAEAEQWAIHRRMTALEETLRSRRLAGGSAAEVAHTYAAYVRDLAEEKTCETRVAAVRVAAQKARADYTDAHRKVETIERLETKARSAHRLECLRQEQAEFDDLAGQRHAQREPQFAL